jgi:signal peptidase I
VIESSLDAPRAFAVVANELIDDRLRAGLTIRFVVPTTSMAPTLLPGDQVIVHAANPAHLRPGDILVVRQQGAWLVHRLIGRSIKGRNLFLFMKGDNSAEPDNPYPAAELYGMVETVERAGRAYSLRSRRAITLGRVIAHLSRIEASMSYVRPRILKRILLAYSHLLVQGVARTGKQVIR